MSLCASASFGQNELELRSDCILYPRTDTGSVADLERGAVIYDTLMGEFMGYQGDKWESFNPEGVKIPQSQELVIPAHDFELDANGDNYNMILGYCYVNSTTNASIFVPIDIPEGAILTNVSLIAMDTAAANDIILRVYIDSTEAGGGSEISQIGGVTRSLHVTDYQSLDKPMTLSAKKSGEFYLARINCAYAGNTSPVSWVNSKMRLSKLIVNYSLPDD